MIYIGNIEILTAKSAIYLGNVGGKLFGLLARPPQHRFENRRRRQEDLQAPEFIDDDVCHLAGVYDGLRDWDREGDNFTESVAVKNPEPVRSSDFDEMLATGLVPMGIIREGCRRDAELLRHIGEHRSGRDFARFQRTARPSHI